MLSPVSINQLYLRLTFPIHSNSADDTHDNQRHSAHDPHIIDTVVDYVGPLMFQEVVQRITEPDGIHARCYCVCEREDYADGRAELRTKGS